MDSFHAATRVRVRVTGPLRSNHTARGAMTDAPTSLSSRRLLSLPKARSAVTTVSGCSQGRLYPLKAQHPPRPASTSSGPYRGRA